MADSRQPTDPPTVYTSVRVTTQHKNWDTLVKKVFYDVDWYIAYPHFGKHGDNEHYHIFVVATDKSGRQRYRDRVKACLGSGNKFVSAKPFKNGIEHAIQYGSKEGTDPTTKGDVQEWIDNSPPWVPGAATRKRKRPTTAIDIDGEEIELGVQLNPYNIEPFAAAFYKKNRLTHKSWRLTIHAMIATNKYRWNFKEKIDEWVEAFWLQRIGGDPDGLERLTHFLCGHDFKKPKSINGEEDEMVEQ